jgi:selenide,water dikinase
LENALKNIPHQNLPGILVGYAHSDDAGVFSVGPGKALVQTVDFFAPIVDDAYTYGQIAAANALSDIYAMGGKPITALSIVAFPNKLLQSSVLTDIMRGGQDKLSDAGVALLGGHSVRDEEVKFGYAVTGLIDPSQIKQNSGARPGARVLLTKPLGTGLVTTAIKRGQATAAHIAAAVASMRELNARASEIAVQFQADTMTDVTGFGLIGHAHEVAQASKVSIEIDHRQLPILPGALDYSRGGYCAGGLNSNREYFSQNIRLSSSLLPEICDLVFDPQTSGGLLIFIRDADSPGLIQALEGAGVAAASIGRTLDFLGVTVSVI